MLRGLRLGVVLLGCTTAAQSSRAQQFTVPQTLTVSNRDRIFPGLYEFSEAGAVVARVRDASAIWYNPAGLALSDRTTFNASSTAYQLTVIGSANGLDELARTASFQPIPSAAGIAFGKEVLDWQGIRLGVGIYNQASWDQSVHLQTPRNPPDPGELRDAARRSTPLIFSGGAGWALDPRYRFGAALLLDYTETGDSGQTSGDMQNGSSLQTVIQTLDFSGNTLHLLASFSAQADPWPWLSLGLVLRTPGIALLRGATVRYETPGVHAGHPPARPAQRRQRRVRPAQDLQGHPGRGGAVLEARARGGPALVPRQRHVHPARHLGADPDHHPASRSGAGDDRGAVRLDSLRHPPGLERQHRGPAPAQRAGDPPRRVLRRPLSGERRSQRASSRRRISPGSAAGSPSPPGRGSPGRSASATSGERPIPPWPSGGCRWRRSRWKSRSPSST